MLLENINGTGVTHDDSLYGHHIFIVQAQGVNVIKKFALLIRINNQSVCPCQTNFALSNIYD
jgi:hypothetical protein